MNIFIIIIYYRTFKLARSGNDNSTVICFTVRDIPFGTIINCTNSIVQIQSWYKHLTEGIHSSTDYYSHFAGTTKEGWYREEALNKGPLKVHHTIRFMV